MKALSEMSKCERKCALIGRAPSICYHWREVRKRGGEWGWRATTILICSKYIHFRVIDKITKKELENMWEDKEVRKLEKRHYAVKHWIFVRWGNCDLSIRTTFSFLQSYICGKRVIHLWAIGAYISTWRIKNILKCIFPHIFKKYSFEWLTFSHHLPGDLDMLMYEDPVASLLLLCRIYLWTIMWPMR